MKDLLYGGKDKNFIERANRRIQYLIHLSPAQKVRDQEIQAIIDEVKAALPNRLDEQAVLSFYRENAFARGKLADLRERLSFAHFKELPQIGLQLSFGLAYKEDSCAVWKTYLNLVQDSLPHFTLIELAQLKHALAGTLPKIGGDELHRGFHDIVFSELDAASL